MIICIDLVVPTLDINGDELVVILRPEQRPHPTIEDLGPEAGDFFRSTA